MPIAKTTRATTTLQELADCISDLAAEARFYGHRPDTVYLLQPVRLKLLRQFLTDGSDTCDVAIATE